MGHYVDALTRELKRKRRKRAVVNGRNCGTSWMAAQSTARRVAALDVQIFNLEAKIARARAEGR